MEVLSPKGSSSSGVSSPYSSPNLGALLKIKVISWSQETGLPVTIQVHVAEKTFRLHKIPLLSKCGYFDKHLRDPTVHQIKLPANFPGGSETFKMIALFIYGSSTFIDPFNVAALRCAAEYLEMTEEYGSGNLCHRTDLYLNQVVLQRWDDTLVVLQKSQTLLPWAEELLIVSRCIESLAFMACMEILDPERKRDRPIVTLKELASQPWNCEKVKEIVSQDLWVKDLIDLPFKFFKRIIMSLRRQGMKEKFVSPLVLFYANKWMLSKKTKQLLECLCEANVDTDTDDKVLEVLQGILDLLPVGEKDGRGIPVGFYFTMLGKSLELGLKSETMARIQEHIVFLLPLAHLEDFLWPSNQDDSISSSMEVVVMASLFSSYVSSNMETNSPAAPLSTSIIAELWDIYVARVSCDSDMETKRFLDLIEIVPISYRQSHDHLYRATATFLQAHPDLSQEEKASVCKYLNCQKISQEVCIEAVQNDLMPLRLIVQALFVQQLNTQQAFRECSESFRYTSCVDFSGSIPSTRYPNSKSQNLGESPYIDGGETGRNPLSSFLQKDIAPLRPENEYESTSFRLHNLEHELVSLKKTLQSRKLSKDTEEVSVKPQDFTPYGLEGRSLSKRRNPLGQVTGCISSVSFSSQRRCANRILKVFKRISSFGRLKSKRR